MQADEVMLKCVVVRGNGYQLNVVDTADLKHFISNPQELWDESPDFFGSYSRNDLIEALRSAKVEAA